MFKILTEFEFDYKLFRALDTKTTDFAKRDGKSYDGWCVEEVDCNGEEAAIYKNDGKVQILDLTNPSVGIRPAINYSQIKSSAKVIRELEEGLKEIEFGEYPQERVEDYLQEQLNQDLLDSRLETTEKKYTIYNNDEQNPDTIRLIEVMDKDGNKYVNKNDTWYKVSPVRWIVNEKTNLAVTKYMIQGGIPYGEYVLPEIAEWEKNIHMKLPPYVRRMHELRRVNPTIIEGFLNVVLSEDLMSEKEKVEVQVTEKEEPKKEEKEKPNDNNRSYSYRIPIYKSPIAQRLFDGIFEETELTSEDYFQKLLTSLDDDKIKLEAALKYLHPTLQEQYVEGKRALRKTLIDYKKNR